MLGLDFLLLALHFSCVNRFYCVCPPSTPSPVDVKNHGTYWHWDSYNVCYLSSYSCFSLQKEEGEGILGLRHLLCFSTWYCPGNQSWTDRKVWSFLGLKRSHDTEQWQWTNESANTSHLTSVQSIEFCLGLNEGLMAKGFLGLWRKVC